MISLDRLPSGGTVIPISQMRTPEAGVCSREGASALFSTIRGILTGEQAGMGAFQGWTAGGRASALMLCALGGEPAGSASSPGHGADRARAGVGVPQDHWIHPAPPRLVGTGGCVEALLPSGEAGLWSQAALPGERVLSSPARSLCERMGKQLLTETSQKSASSRRLVNPC